MEMALGDSVALMVWLLLFVDIVLVIVVFLLWQHIRNLRDGIEEVEEVLQEAGQQLGDAGRQLRDVAEGVYASYRAKEECANSCSDGGELEAEIQAPPSPSSDDILELLKHGYDFRKIANRLKISVDHVRLVSRVHGVCPEDRT